ncbi:hypothetical protein D3C86_2138020 [compost metagenome]
MKNGVDTFKGFKEGVNVSDVAMQILAVHAIKFRDVAFRTNQCIDIMTLIHKFAG